MCSSDCGVSENDIIPGEKQYSKKNQRQNGLYRTRSVELTSLLGIKTIDRRFENQESGKNDAKVDDGKS